MLRQKSDILIVTNNERIKEKYESDFAIKMADDYRNVLIMARDAVYEGYKLLTHPQSSSLKPNQTPIKTIILECAGGHGKLDMDSVMLIERAIEVYDKFLSCHSMPEWREKTREDFRTIDLSIMEPAIWRL